MEDDPQQVAQAIARKELKAYATEIEISEVLNRKVMKLRCDLIYGPEKHRDDTNHISQLDFNYYSHL